MHAACTIGLSINEDLKLEKRKGKDKRQREKLYTIPWSREGHVGAASTITSTITLSQLTQALGEEFPPAVGVVQNYGPCGWIHVLAGGFLTEGLRDFGRLCVRL